MTSIRNTAIAAAHESSSAVLDALDAAGHTVQTITLHEGQLTIHLAHGTARAAVAALFLTAEYALDYPATTERHAFSAAHCTLVTIPITVIGEYDPQVPSTPVRVGQDLS